jgi:hypothetical protein
MGELPEFLKKYLPGPLAVLLGIVWWAGSDRVKELLQTLFSDPAAHILIQDHADDLHVVRIEISRHSEKAFEDVQVEIDLQAKPRDIRGELMTLDGARTPLVFTARNSMETILVFNRVGTKPSVSPITMQPRESLEITLHEGPAAPILDVSINSKEHKVIAASDLNQRYRLPEVGWRAGLAVLAICAIYYFPTFLLHVFARRARKQLDADVEFLHKCWQRAATALATFNTELQPAIDAGTAKYLKAFSSVVRDENRLHVIPQQIFLRAETLPRFRRSLKGEVERFVITFCLGIAELEYKALKNIAKKELKRIQ